jgi:alcohol dehydrogenase
LPFVEDFNSDVCPQKFKNIAVALGRDVKGFTLEEARIEAINALKDMAESLNIPKLKDTAFNPADIKKLAAQAMADVCTGGNPREVTIEDIKAIYLNAYEDDLVAKSFSKKHSFNHLIY